MVGGRPMNVMGKDDGSFAAMDPIKGASYPMMGFVHRVPVARIDIPKHLAIVELSGNTVDRRVRRSVGRTKNPLGIW